MAGVLLLSCLLLAVAGVTSVQSATNPVRRDAQQLTEEPLREKRTAPLQTSKSDDCLGAVVAQQAAELSSLKDKLHALEISQLTAKSELQSTKSECQTTKGELQASQAKLESSSFVRWGRKSCPNNTALVYSGVAGGKQHSETGSGTNRLCLTRTPQFDNTTKPRMYGNLYGAEYEEIPGHHDRKVPCSVCLAPQSTTIMVPATLTCPPGWTPQYTGHLASERNVHHYGGEYVCLDGSPEDDSSVARNHNGLLFYYVVTVCGSLPCPPYINNKVVTCVVCSK